MTPDIDDGFMISLHADPFVQFRMWYAEAAETRLMQPNAMTLATATKQGRPSARIILMKSFDEEGLKFVSNYLSRKGEEIDENHFVAALFHWAELERQVRIEGTIERIAGNESDRLFAARPREHQLSSASSHQSKPATLAELDKRYTELEREFQGRDVPRPEAWGGYRIIPESFEFWQHRFARMNDRVVYNKQSDQGWTRVRLSP